MKKFCVIYEIEKGRHSYKIFESNEDLQLYLKKNKWKVENANNMKIYFWWNTEIYVRTINLKLMD